MKSIPRGTLDCLEDTPSEASVPLLQESPSAYPEALEFLEAAASWVAEGFPVFLKVLWYDSSGKLIKGGFRLCQECQQRKDSGVSAAECGCSCLLCHGEHKATLDLHRFVEMLAEAHKRRKGSARIGLAVRLPVGVLVLDIDRHPGGADGLDSLARLDLLGCDGRGELIRTEPETRLLVSAGGGYHYYFRGAPEAGSLPRNPLPGLEVKQAGDSLLVPPTVLPGNRGCYWDSATLSNAKVEKEPGVPEMITPQPTPIQPAPARLLKVLAGLGQVEQHVKETTREKARQQAAQERAAHSSTFSQPGEHRASSSGSDDPVALVIERLENTGRRVQRKGARSWLAQCPAHDDKHPSLAITEADDKVLLKCWSDKGCDYFSITQALELQPSDLFRRNA